ncbi:unnamed protein product, partial [Amoebophrya sp. A120]
YCLQKHYNNENPNNAQQSQPYNQHKLWPENYVKLNQQYFNVVPANHLLPDGQIGSSNKIKATQFAQTEMRKQQELLDNFGIMWPEMFNTLECLPFDHVPEEEELKNPGSFKKVDVFANEAQVLQEQYPGYDKTTGEWGRGTKGNSAGQSQEKGRQHQVGGKDYMNKGAHAQQQQHGSSWVNGKNNQAQSYYNAATGAWTTSSAKGGSITEPVGSSTKA